MISVQLIRDSNRLLGLSKLVVLLEIGKKLPFSLMSNSVITPGLQFFNLVQGYFFVFQLGRDRTSTQGETRMGSLCTGMPMRGKL